MAERLQKLIAAAGILSRRAAESAISAGKIKVNRELAVTGQQVDKHDEVNIDGWHYKVFAEKRRPKIYVYNKPEGEICTQDDPEGRPTVFNGLPRLDAARWVMVGRLDINTQGLLLFSSDGKLANKLMHPSSEIQRVYSVRVRGEVDEQMLNDLRNGVELEDGVAKFDSISWPAGETEAQNRWFTVSIGEGRNREVRRMWESQGLAVSRLIRRAYGPIELPRRLRRGKGEFMQDAQIDQLCKAVDYSAEYELLLRDARKANKRSHEKSRGRRR